MAYGQPYKLTVTTDASGNATAYVPTDAEGGPIVNGKVISVQYTKIDFADTVDFTITGEDSGEGIWTESNVTASKIVRPTVLVQDQLGVDTASNRDYVFLANERIKIVIAQGGDTKSGTFRIIVE
jgi:hypothetical protein